MSDSVADGLEARTVAVASRMAARARDCVPEGWTTEAVVSRWFVTSGGTPRRCAARCDDEIPCWSYIFGVFRSRFAGFWYIRQALAWLCGSRKLAAWHRWVAVAVRRLRPPRCGPSCSRPPRDRKSTRLNSSHLGISY